ncbi:exodeoxyribonuclease V subunit gamma [Rodentibacter trehalosifermentans]|uniref:RecBCD enzyme subunit RecC n=1 Tax=Rodentibacter trehalosifermentans TaxID=1908263 RepID=A0A1V3IQY8_9PAST|nr:exodeoxyribonuclease V subunit gamma [Rodentibacter trehalosifermentans]OOF44531.1 exodeoxyribonuclease V subunit gamma [Rodentibacter trehalosifermentans]OOF46690.1 exodeoxyribonuclease V subunit gamma [Rodentibacter trehalosifermentans]OOF52517.1 exodeoxyribonuclease V subunit gamma [Rodentibacter trehalosifermentans]
MFIVYHSNQLEKQKDILAELFKTLPRENPLQQEIILVQSPGMAQWLQMELAKKNGVSAHLAFPMPATFIWQLYADNLPSVSLQNPFDKDSMMWRLMKLMPDFLEREAFLPLRHYLASSPHSEQYKRYQLSRKIADLFDQYLVYRPEWIFAWEKGDDEHIAAQIKAQQNHLNDTLLQQILGNVVWQGTLWRALVSDIKADMGENVTHRAALHEQFLALLNNKNQLKKLPNRLFIFGIPALPTAYLSILQAMSSEVDIHLFFNNPSQEYWGDIRDLRMDYLCTRSRQNYQKQTEIQPLFSEARQSVLRQGAVEATYHNENLQAGNPLLAAWGKMGRDFLYTLIRDEEQIPTYSLNAYEEISSDTLLGQLQSHILHLENKPLNLEKNDRSLTVHACHSAMREVEVLQDYLLHLFNQDPTLTPKDVVVMVADINQYTPYIQAVFGQKNGDTPLIPFSISDNKLSESDVLVSCYLALLRLKESTFSAEEILTLLDIPALRERFKISLSDLPLVREWVAEAGIRFGLQKNQEGINFNSWQAGLERMVLGYAMREEHGIWRDSLGFDSSYGLKGLLAGNLSRFFTALSHWHRTLQQAHSIEKWQEILTALLTDFFVQSEETHDTLFYIQEKINELAQQLSSLHFDLPLQADVITDVMMTKLEDAPNSLKFLAGKVNFCTLLPMRAVPFKVVCLLGMNEADYPRTQTPNSFDLMQYHHQKGDRVRRDDDRYLFLEALLAARDYCYISYIGRSIIDNQEREPSVLVSQLLDYINQNQEDERRIQIQEHSMMVFNPSNFKNSENFDRSFAAKWLPMVKNSGRVGQKEFISVMENAEQITEIELDRFIGFVENPVKFFFEKQLGVYFRDTDDRIPDSENFTLSKLDEYALNNALIYKDKEEFEGYFEQATVKGVLPRARFGQVTAENVRDTVLEFKDKIAELGEPHNASVDFDLTVSWQGKSQLIRLFGYMENLFEGDQVVEWHFAKYKDRYLIRPWLYYLIQCVTQETTIPPKLITKDRVVDFPSIEPETALVLLQTYAQAYLQSQIEIQPIPTVGNIENFIIKEESAVDFDGVLTKLQKLAEEEKRGNYTKKADPYWARLLAQTTKFEDRENLLALLKQTTDWFGELFAKEEKKSANKKAK